MKYLRKLELIYPCPEKFRTTSPRPVMGPPSWQGGAFSGGLYLSRKFSYRVSSTGDGASLLTGRGLFWRTIHNEEGQAVVQAMIAFMVLLAFVGMAIDIGNVYAERRKMQNAADAGALAGARELCLLNDANAAAARAEEYMTLNGVLAADIDPADVTIAGNVVSTTADETADLHVADFVGFPTMDIQASAAAACGRAS